MSRCYLALILFPLLVSTNSAAADYLLRLETAELRELPNGKQEPDARTHETVELLVHAGKRFYGSTSIGTDRVLLHGKLEEANDGALRVQVHYRKKSAAGESVPSGNGQRLPISNAIELKTDVIPVSLGKAVDFDANASRSKRIRASLSINHFEVEQLSPKEP